MHSPRFFVGFYAQIAIDFRSKKPHTGGMLETLIRVVVFFAFIGLGAILARTKKLTQQGLDGLSAYFYWLGFPAWLMVSFSQLPPLDTRIAIDLAGYAAAMIVCAAVVVAAVLTLRGKRSDALAAGMAGFINNSAFLGVPVVTSLFGPAVARLAPLIVAADFLILFTLGCAALAKASGHTFRMALVRTAQNPTVIGALLGVVLWAGGVHFPPAVEGALELLGKSGPPVALVALGGMLGFMPVRTLVAPDRASAVAVTGKLLLAPVLVAAVLASLHADPLLWKVAVFLSATPTAVSVFIQARVYGVWYEGAARTVAQATVLSLVTLCALAVWLA